MASAFLGKGAQAYFGYDDYVLASYAHDAGEELFDNFVLDKANIGESYSDAISTAGSSDGTGADFIWKGESSLSMGGQKFSNTSFESGNLTSWAANGDARIITSLGALNPSQGSFMSVISTGLGSVSDSTSSIQQNMCTAQNHNTLKFDYNLVSEEPTEYLDSSYDDRLYAYLTVNGSTSTILSKGINDSQWSYISGIDFAGGDSTTYQTGWQTFTYSLAAIPNGADVELKFEISDVGDSSYDTAALIDNIRVE
jgi:hypothetical protein